MPDAAASEPNRTTWLVIWAAMTAATVVYYFVGAQVAGTVASTPSLASLRFALSILAPVELLAGAVLLSRAGRARADATGLAMFLGGDAPPPPRVFQVAWIIGAAMVEACAIMGFVLIFLGAPLTNYLPFGLASLAVMLGVGLPTGLRYWSEWEQAQARGGGPIE